MRALTLWQPWAWAMGCGLKKIENRPWEPPAWMINVHFALHAGLKYDRPSADALWGLLDFPAEPVPPRKAEAVLGAVIAVTRLVAVVTTREAAERIGGENQGRFFFGPFGWVVSATYLLPEPVPCRGYQKLWTLPEEIADAVEAQL